MKLFSKKLEKLRFNTNFDLYGGVRYGKKNRQIPRINGTFKATLH